MQVFFNYFLKSTHRYHISTIEINLNKIMNTFTFMTVINKTTAVLFCLHSKKLLTHHQKQNVSNVTKNL